MVRSRARRGKTLVSGVFQRVVIWILAFFAGFSLLIFFILQKAKPPTPLTVLFVADPIVLVVYHSETSRPSQITFPIDLQIEGLYGTGQYSLESLWKLEILDKSGKNLLSDSLEEAIGMPINRVVSLGDEELTKLNVQEPNISSRLTPRYWLQLSVLNEGNARFRDIVWMWWLFGSLESLEWQNVNISESSAVQSDQLTDGTPIRLLVQKGLDIVLKSHFENLAFRQEAVSTAVYNTTGVPLVGLRVTRMLDNLGIYVISVGNFDIALRDCELIGELEVLETKTAKFLENYFQCQLKVESTNEAADLVLRIGTTYSDRFTDGITRD